MATIKVSHSSVLTGHGETTTPHFNLWNRFALFADEQAGNRTLWFFMVLMVHGVFLLPLPIVLIYYFNAHSLVLVVTMVCFFANLIANMAGAGIRTTLAFFLASISIHILMALVSII